MVQTVQDNLGRLVQRLGYMQPATVIRVLNRGVLNSDVTSSDVRNSFAVHGGPLIAVIKGKTTKRASVPNVSDLVPRVTQVQQ